MSYFRVNTHYSRPSHRTFEILNFDKVLSKEKNFFDLSY